MSRVDRIKNSTGNRPRAGEPREPDAQYTSSDQAAAKPSAGKLPVSADF